MESPENNLLVRLHKWAWRQDENFLTESFAHLLQHLLDNEPEAAVGFLRSLTAGFLNLRVEQARSLEVRTQIFTSEGTPDLELRTNEQLVIIEVKSESSVAKGQLKRYRQVLQDSGVASTRLILLTRYPAGLGHEDERPDDFIRWYQVAEHVDDERSRYRFQPVSGYLVDQFLDFLGVRNMTMGQVTWDLAGGVRALRTLGYMLYEAACANNIQATLQGHRDSMGASLEKKAYWVGIYYDRPEILCFQTNKRPVDPETAARLGIEGIHPWDTDKSKYWWKKTLDLASEDVHFFARLKAAQMQVLESFLKECVQIVKRIEIPGEHVLEGPGPSDEDSDSGADK